MGKLWWVSRVGLPIAAITGIVTFIAVMPLQDVSRIGLMAMCGALGAITGTNIGIGMMRRAQREPDTARFIPLTLPEALGRKIQNYCTDCGKQFVTSRSHDGFNPHTGADKVKTRRHCPDYAKPIKGLPAGYSSAFMFGTDYPNCGNILAKRSKPVSNHSHPNPYKTDMGCPACIDQMLTDGVITDMQASDLLRKTGLFN